MKGLADKSSRDGGGYRRRLYASYRSTHFDDLASSGELRQMKHDVLRRLPGDRGSRIVELGCGSGELLAAMQESGYTQVAGVDVSEEQVEVARRREVEVAHSDLFDYLAGLDGPVDAFVAVDVLEHLTKEEVLRCLGLIYEGLAGNGAVVLRVPNAQSLFGGRYRYGDFTHETSFTQHSVRQILLASGFSSIEIYPVEPAVHGLLSAMRKAGWKVVSTCLKLVLATETGFWRGEIVTQNLVAVARRAEKGRS